MTRLKLILGATALGMVMAVPASAQSVREFVVRVPDPCCGVVVPGLEPNPQPQVEHDVNLTRNNLGFDQDDNRITPRMNRAQRREVAARCEFILANPGAFSMDAVEICEAALLDDR